MDLDLNTLEEKTYESSILSPNVTKRAPVRRPMPKVEEAIVIDDELYDLR